MSTIQKIKETWKYVVGWENLYSVSNLGQVRSNQKVICYFRKDHGKINVRTIKTRILKPGKIKKGYLLVKLTNGDRQECQYVHRIVLLAFKGKPIPPRYEVRHLNGVPYDNRLVNLKYGTTKENGKDTIRHNQEKK